MGVIYFTYYAEEDGPFKRDVTTKRFVVVPRDELRYVGMISYDGDDDHNTEDELSATMLRVSFTLKNADDEDFTIPSLREDTMEAMFNDLTNLDEDRDIHWFMIDEKGKWQREVRRPTGVFGKD